MRIKKKIFAMLMMLCMVLQMLPNTVLAETVETISGEGNTYIGPTRICPNRDLEFSFTTDNVGADGRDAWIGGIDKIDETVIGNRLIQLAEQYKIPYSNIVYDADGLRKFTAQSLKKLTASQPFTNNAPPKKDKNFGNIKAECAFKLRRLLDNNEVLCLDHEFRKQIVSDLESIRLAEPEPEGKIRLEKKSKHKERTGKSPDFFDSLLMRCYFEIKPSGGWG